MWLSDRRAAQGACTRRAPSLLLVSTMFALGCGRGVPADPPAGEARVPDAAAAEPVPAQATERAPGASAGRPECIRGGSTREEVRAAMGEPDSISFGAWMYGRSSVSFGYGTVVDVSNDGGNLILCR